MKTLEDLERDAGNDLVKLLNCILSEKESIDWFYNKKIPTLEGETPFEYIQTNGEKGREYLYTRLMAHVTGGIGI